MVERIKRVDRELFHNPIVHRFPVPRIALASMPQGFPVAFAAPGSAAAFTTAKPEHFHTAC